MRSLGWKVRRFWVDELKQDLEDRLLEAQNESNNAHAVLQDIVHIARLSPDAFLALIEQEFPNWNTVDLKYIAATIHNRLRYLKKKKAKEGNDISTSEGDDAVIQQHPSMTQALYSYVVTEIDR